MRDVIEELNAIGASRTLGIIMLGPKSHLLVPIFCALDYELKTLLQDAGS